MAVVPGVLLDHVQHEGPDVDGLRGPVAAPAARRCRRSRGSPAPSWPPRPRWRRCAKSASALGRVEVVEVAVRAGVAPVAGCRPPRRPPAAGTSSARRRPCAAPGRAATSTTAARRGSPSCSPVSPPHFHSRVARWYSSSASAASRSAATFGLVGRSTAGAVQVHLESWSATLAAGHDSGLRASPDGSCVGTLRGQSVLGEAPAPRKVPTACHTWSTGGVRTEPVRRGLDARRPGDPLRGGRAVVRRGTRQAAGTTSTSTASR